MEMKWTFADRTSWKKGPWDQESIDKKVWKDKETGLDCMIHRGPFGSWCGYVGLTKSHKLYGVSDSGDEGVQLQDLYVHGGVTFTGACQGMEENGHGICHPADEGDHVWWVGFDCAHLYDDVPSVKTYGKPTYRTMEYVEAQTKELAMQLFELQFDK